MSKELIQALQSTKLDGITGYYYGGNDEGGIQSMEVFILRPDHSIKEWPKGVGWEQDAREISIVLNLHGHVVGGHWVDTVSLLPAEGIEKAGIPPEWDLYERFVKPFDDIIDSNYGSFAGEFSVSGEFYATRDGRFSVTDSISTESWEDQTLASECYHYKTMTL